MEAQSAKPPARIPTSSLNPQDGGASSPRLPQGHLFDSELGPHLLVTNGSRVYGVGRELAAAADAAMTAGGSATMDALLAKHGLDAPAYIEDKAPESFPVRSLSLAVAQKCNLGCTYCYAVRSDRMAQERNQEHDPRSPSLHGWHESTARASDAAQRNS